MKHEILTDPARPEGRPVKKPARHPNGQPYRMPRPISRLFDAFLKEQIEAALMNAWVKRELAKAPRRTVLQEQMLRRTKGELVKRAHTRRARNAQEPSDR
ncbi:hypothetical protein ACFVNB_09050 [Streptomyces rochei]|uniref:hypothetical protein n=1 Tax=Streptomyces rochei TaxID=1928 RepID=UPI0036B47671